MHETTITVQYVNPPDKYPAWGSVKTKDGERYSVPARMVSLFEAGKTYTVGFTKDAKGYSTIKEVQDKSSGASIPQANGHSYKPYNGGADPRQIFVCAIVKEWVPKIPIGETTTLVEAIQCAMDAYDQTFGTPDHR